MPKSKSAQLKIVGMELYFDNLTRAKKFYRDTLGLTLANETPGHHAQFSAGNAFLCLERKGAEKYPSADKAVLFFEVPNLAATIKSVGHKRILRHEPKSGQNRQAWAVLHDPEGHNILLLQSQKRKRRRRGTNSPGPEGPGKLTNK
ncbi:MAG: VOC family protein [Candidatus Acidiferrales bacterium]